MTLLTKKEIRDLTYYGYHANNIKIPESGQEIDSLILISKGRKSLHDSGYPFILVLGADNRNHTLYDLGSCHDNVWFTSVGSVEKSDNNVNIDSLGKNIFRMWRHIKLNIAYGKASGYGSTITCSSDGTVG